MKYLAIIAALAASPAIAEPQFRIGATLGSYHFGGHADEFNQLNLGLNLGVTFRTDKRFQYGFQAGAYHNSYYESTTYALGFADYRLFNIGAGEIRAGGFAGFFEYPAIAARMDNWPTIGDYVLIVGPQVKLRTGRGVDFTVGYIPQYSTRVNGILTLSASMPFGGGS